MNKTGIVLVLALFAFFCAGNSVIAQPYADSGKKDYLSGIAQPGLSIIDPSRISTSHSYSFSYFSNNGHSGSVGMLMNSIEYRVSDPLKITLNLGVMHNPSAFIGQSSNGLSPTIMPGINVQYRPSENVFLMMNFESIPAGAGYRYGYPGYYGYSPYLWDRR